MHLEASEDDPLSDSSQFPLCVMLADSFTADHSAACSTKLCAPATDIWRCQGSAHHSGQAMKPRHAIHERIMVSFQPLNMPRFMHAPHAYMSRKTNCGLWPRS